MRSLALGAARAGTRDEAAAAAAVFGFLLVMRNSRSAGSQNLAGPFQVGRSIDAERNRVNEADLDTHAVLERPKLLQFLPPLQRGRRQRNEALERAAPVSIHADVMVKRPLSIRCRRAREIQRPEPTWPYRRAHHLHHTRTGPLLLEADLAAERGNIDRVVAQRLQARAQQSGLHGRQVALHVED